MHVSNVSAGTAPHSMTTPKRESASTISEVLRFRIEFVSDGSTVGCYGWRGPIAHFLLERWTVLQYQATRQQRGLLRDPAYLARSIAELPKPGLNILRSFATWGDNHTEWTRS